MPRDIEEFLRQAAARRQKQKQQPVASPPPAPPRVGRQVPPARPKPRHPPLDEGIQIIEAESTGDMRAQTVKGHVQAHIDTSKLDEHASHLGQEVSLADEKLEMRLQQRFEHDVGRLQLDEKPSAQSETTKVTETRVSPIAQQLVKVLKTPGNVRQAIMLSEILKRPEI